MKFTGAETAFADILLLSIIKSYCLSLWKPANDIEPTLFYRVFISFLLHTRPPRQCKRLRPKHSHIQKSILVNKRKIQYWCLIKNKRFNPSEYNKNKNNNKSSYCNKFSIRI